MRLKSIRHCILLLALCCTAVSAHAGSLTTSAAFAAGTSFGQSNNATNAANINTGTASGMVPNYTTTNSASSYFNNGQGTLSGPAASGVSTCVSTTSDPNQYAHGNCEAVRMLENNPGAATAAFPINPATDPLMTARNTAINNPSTYLGSMNPTGSGAYSGCVPETVTTPATYTTQTCVKAYGTFTQTCNKVLTVQVSQTTSTITTLQPGYSLYPPIGVTCDSDGVGTILNYGSSMCEFNDVTGVNMTSSSYCSGQHLNPISGTNPQLWNWFRGPEMLCGFVTSTINIYTYTDTWNDQCASLEAQVAP